MQSVAEKKKSQNIGEYLIYMYQMEDLIRSFQGNMDEIRQYVISHYPVADEEKDKIFGWFASLRDQMEKENILEKGHLQELHLLVEELLKIHYQVLKTDPDYFQLYTQAKPHIMDAVLASQGLSPGNEIQICLNGIYGLLLCRLLGKKVDESQLEAADSFGNVLSMLSHYYRFQEKG